MNLSSKAHEAGADRRNSYVARIDGNKIVTILSFVNKTDLEM
jgi:hypothetical protein